MPSSLAEWALYYASLGWPVLPLHSWDQTICTCNNPACTSPAKHPRTRNGLKDATTTHTTLRSWWGRWPAANIGLRTGVVFDVLDVDGEDGFEAIATIEKQHGQAPPGPSSFTGGGGLHRLYRPSGAPNRAGLLNHVDWRGEGGYIVDPPSLHATGNVYEWADSPLDVTAELLPVTGWLHQLLFPPQPPPRPPTSSGASSPNSAYARRALDSEISEIIRTHQGGRNAQLNTSAFNLYQLVAGGELDETEVTAALTNAGLGAGLGDAEIRATLASAHKAGLAQPRAAPALTVIGNTARKTDPAVNLSPEPSTSTPSEADELTGWEPVDVEALLAGDLTIPPPTLYARSDGTRLIYAGKIHAFNGEPESGKSWCAQHATAQTISEGHHVCYIDFEDSAQSVLGRLLALGVPAANLAARFTYLAPDRPLGLDAGQVLRAHFQLRPPELTIIDGVTEAMSTLGLDPLDNADTAKFFRALPRPLTRYGSAVVLVDHVTKDKEDRGRWAIGAQHKMAALTGAAYTIEVVVTLGRNKNGLIRVLVTKDRPGYIRQHAAGNVIAELHLHSRDDVLTTMLRPPSGAGDGPVRYSGYMERISLKLEHSRALTTNEVKAVVGGKAEYVGIALRALVEEGYVAQSKQGQAVWHSSTRPFRETTEDDESF